LKSARTDGLGALRNSPGKSYRAKPDC